MNDSTDPRVSNRVLVCRDCLQPLEIVCPTHGRTVSRVVEDAPRLSENRHAPTAAPHAKTPRDGTIRHRIVTILQSRTAESPCTTDEIAEALHISKMHAAVELRYLVNQSFVMRGSRGQYFGARNAGGADV